MSMHIALLRGINVTGRNKLPMKDLAGMFESAGCGEVRTYIQSGNVAFMAGEKLTAQVPALISAAIEEQFGYQIPVVIRSAEQMAEIVAGNPFVTNGIEEKQLHVAFLADVPGAEAIAGLDPMRSPPDEFVVSGAEIYLRFPQGVARSKLTNAYFDRALGTVSTMRNWRTTQKLLEMTGG